MEAHGGYSFCGLAALSLMGRTSLCDLRACMVGCTGLSTYSLH